MARARNKLTAKGVAALSAPGFYSDGNRLYLAIDQNGRRRWVLRYMLRGKQRDLGIGSPIDVALKEARELAAEANALLRKGIDPLERKRQVAAVQATPTFGEYIEEFLAAKRPEWANAKHGDQWCMTLTKYAAPLHGVTVDKIATTDVLECLKPLWLEKPETASRLRGRIEAVLDAAKAAGHRAGENPASWAGNLKHLLPKHSGVQSHHAALAYGDVPAFMARLREQEGMGALALQFAILTAARSGEVRGALWSEIDITAKLWVIPAARMKAGREHRIPLSDRALAILAESRPLARDGASLVFPGARGGKPLSDMSMSAVLKRMNLDVTPHGFRSAFRDWAGDATMIQREVVEAALAHVIGDKAEQAYRRGDALAKRRELMEAWSAYVGGVSASCPSAS